MAALVYALVLLALTGLAGWGTLRLLAQRSLVRSGLGLLFLFACVILPFFLGYGWAYGTLAAVLGAVVAGVQLFGKVGWLARVGLVVVIAFIAIEPAAWLWVDNLQTARDGHYPPDIHTVAVDSDRYESPSCPIYQNVDWLYRSGSQGYTVGYWNDWLLLGKHICLHTSGHQGWNCGLNQWGPFRPGETG